MSTRFPSTAHDIASALLLLVIGVGSLYAFTNMTVTSWSARSWKPTVGEVDHAGMRSSKGRRKRSARPDVAYTYVVDGVRSQGNKLTLGWFPGVTENHEEIAVKKLTAGQPVIVWVNPRRPMQSVLYRAFDWQAALCWFLIAQLALFMSSGYFRGDPEPSEGAMIAPVRESVGGMLLIVLGNVMILPAAVISLLELRLWPILTFTAMLGVGLFLLGVKCHSLRRRWQVGMPFFADASDGSGLSTARFIFSPRYGERLAGLTIRAYASVEWRQMLYRSVDNKEKIEAIQTGTIGPQRLEFGKRSIDFTAQLPSWPTGHDVRPALWEIDFKVAGTTFTYRVPADFRQ